uniref:G0/G1 switch 2 n=1 Tax=Chelydra serpentina TaxID=8475 RepID=A0A8C3RZ44_CHESE
MLSGRAPPRWPPPRAMRSRPREGRSRPAPGRYKAQGGWGKQPPSYSGELSGDPSLRTRGAEPLPRFCDLPDLWPEMETMQELIPFAKEMLSQKPSRKMVKIYMLGSMLAFFGVVISLVETVCSPFTAEEQLEEEEEKRPPPTKAHMVPQKQGDLIVEKSKEQGVMQRNLVIRQRAS